MPLKLEFCIKYYQKALPVIQEETAEVEDADFALLQSRGKYLCSAFT